MSHHLSLILMREIPTTVYSSDPCVTTAAVGLVPGPSLCWSLYIVKPASWAGLGWQGWLSHYQPCPNLSCHWTLPGPISQCLENIYYLQGIFHQHCGIKYQLFVNLFGTITQINISFEKKSISLFVTLHIFFFLNIICISYKIISYINMIVTIVSLHN